MTLTENQLWALGLIVPALVSGVVSSTVAFLLGRLRREPVFPSFGWFTLTLTAYGLIDGILSWAPHDLSQGWFVALGFADLLLMGTLTWRLAVLGSDLLGQPRSRWFRGVFLAPLAAAGVLVLVVGSSLETWSSERLVLVGQVFLLLLFSATLYWAAALILGWRRVHDRLFRRLLAATGALFLAFVPLWLWDALGRGGHYSFYWFFLTWNLGALVLAARAFFEPPPGLPSETLFASSHLEACAARYGLTSREAEVAGLHAQGYSAKEIGAALFIAPKTVRNHISNLYQKTGTGQRRELLDLVRSSR